MLSFFYLKKTLDYWRWFFGLSFYVSSSKNKHHKFFNILQKCHHFYFLSFYIGSLEN